MSSSGASSSISGDIRTPRTTDGSYSKASWGVRFSRSSRAMRAWRTPCAAGAPRARLALALAAKDAHEHARRAKIGRGLDAGDRHEADPGIVQVRHDPPRAPRAGTSFTRRIRSGMRPNLSTGWSHPP